MPTRLMCVRMTLTVVSGFDGAIHMSEETQQAKLAVPRAMFWSN